MTSPNQSLEKRKFNFCSWETDKHDSMDLGCIMRIRRTMLYIKRHIKEIRELGFNNCFYMSFSYHYVSYTENNLKIRSEL